MKASTFWDVTVPRVMTIYANAVFLVLWVGFVIALGAGAARQHVESAIQNWRSKIGFQLPTIA